MFVPQTAGFGGIVIVDLRLKLERLMKLACDGDGITHSTLHAEMEKSQKIRPAISKKWFTAAHPDIRTVGRKKFIAYWKSVHKIHFTDEHFEMPWAEFDKAFPLPKKTIANATFASDAEQLAKFAGVYQVVRPHAFHTDRYVLEALEIAIADGQCTIRTFSHTGSRLEYLYEGEGHFANRYCSAIMHRQHEKHAGGVAFRCIMLYLGALADPKRISGVILRGVSGEAGSDQPLGVPFIALRIPDSPPLNEADFTQGREDDFLRVHRNGSIVVGLAMTMAPDVEQSNTEAIYRWCHAIYQQLRNIEHCIKCSNDIVIHSIAPSELNRIRSLDHKVWRPLVDAHFAAEIVDED